MAKYDDLGHCPIDHIRLDESNDLRLVGLLSLVGDSIVYEKNDLVGIEADFASCDKIFYSDCIAYTLLSSIIRKNVNADMIIVHQLHSCEDSDFQDLRDIPYYLGCYEDSMLIMEDGSHFAVVLGEAKYGLDLWVWDLKISRNF